jgi:Cys-tRNA(Pro)/Cys-tRNA(Cys) deacylase
MKKKFPTLIDETVELFETVSVSAGIRGMLVFLAPRDLIRLTGASTAELTG